MGCDIIPKVAILLLALISIHAPIVGCDSSSTLTRFRLIIISIHAPIVGCDRWRETLLCCNVRFQSTHPSWGATIALTFQFSRLRFQSTHPSWGATTPRFIAIQSDFISIHAPIVGCDEEA